MGQPGRQEVLQDRVLEKGGGAEGERPEPDWTAAMAGGWRRCRSGSGRRAPGAERRPWPWRRSPEHITSVLPPQEDGFEKGDEYFKQMGKGMLCTYALFGAAWLWNETSPLGWWTLKPRSKYNLPRKCPFYKTHVRLLHPDYDPKARSDVHVNLTALLFRSSSRLNGGYKVLVCGEWQPSWCPGQK